MKSRQETEETPLLTVHGSDKSSEKPVPVYLDQDENLSARQRCCKWFDSVFCKIYTSQIMSAWGDRMWNFAVALFLIYLTKDSLQLTAIYGFAGGGASMVMGAVIGDWVDRNPRLFVARTSLLVQNLFVILCCVVLVFIVKYEDVFAAEDNVLYRRLVQSLVIILAVIASLASLASNLSIQKDWLVVICGGDKIVLTDTCAVMRRIDLTTKILAPLMVGQIMTYLSVLTGAIFIAAWNLVSFFLEYYLIWRVYVATPRLAYKESEPTGVDLKVEEEKLTAPEATSQLENGISTKVEHEANTDETVAVKVDTESTKEDNGKMKEDTTEPKIVITKLRTNTLAGCFWTLMLPFTRIYKGWYCYMTQSIRFAGIALACLYMTVLGFDNITTGYAYSQGMTESILGILSGVGAVFGLTGTFGYQYIRPRIGLVRTGALGLALEIGCLSFCVWSVWAPGSPFDPYFTGNHSTPESNVTHDLNVTDMMDEDNDVVGSTSVPVAHEPRRMESLILLLAGIILARFGLWTADLTISQLLLENVEEKKRGVVNGVQSSLNRMMDMLKFIMVIVAPWPETFGILVIISFLFICLALVFYAVFMTSYREHSVPANRTPESKHDNKTDSN